MSEKYHFIFQNVKNVWSTVSFCPVAKHETSENSETVPVQSYFRGDI